MDSYNLCQSTVVSLQTDLSVCNNNIINGTNDLATCNSQKESLNTYSNGLNELLNTCKTEKNDLNDNLTTRENDYDTLIKNVARPMCCSAFDILEGKEMNWDIDNNALKCGTGSFTVNCTTGTTNY